MYIYILFLLFLIYVLGGGCVVVSCICVSYPLVAKYPCCCSDAVAPTRRTLGKSVLRPRSNKVLYAWLVRILRLFVPSVGGGGDRVSAICFFIVFLCMCVCLSLRLSYSRCVL